MPGILILVESPNKARKIQDILGRGYTVRATIGHICDLPTNEYGVDLDTFEETYVPRNAKLVADLRALAKRFDTILLATDPDREGEAIAWHIARELHLDLAAANRIEFQEITTRAIQAAVRTPRPIDQNLVDAARARRVLDRIVGFDVSQEICWPAGAKSAGRVQTPALHILCERERAIQGFKPRTYWTLTVEYREGFSAFVPADDEQAETPSTEDSDDVGQARRARPREFPTRADAEAVLALARKHPHVVRAVGQEKVLRKPEPPYTTSTLLQDASRKLRLSAAQAADLAQQLFEAGYITYHRTDSTRVSPEAIAMAREYIAKEHPESLPPKANEYRAKSGAQDAHEAIRPTHLEGDDSPPAAARELYLMIRARFLASQCKPAEYKRTTIEISSGPVDWVAEGSILTDPGYLVYWRPYARQTDELLPEVRQDQQLDPLDYAVNEKQTSPPPRFDTGSLIKKLEVSGVGRPSTYKTIIQTLLSRGYAEEVKGGRGKEFIKPTDFGMKVDGLLTAAFPALVSEEYTATMEASLDQIEARQLSRLGYLKSWYSSFRQEMASAVERAAQYRAENSLAPRSTRGEPTTIPCDRCGAANYNKISRRTQKGSFLACPNCGMTRNVRAKVRPGACKKCGSSLIEKNANGNKFWGCVRFGAVESPCDYTEREDGSPAGRYNRREYHKKCLRCRKHNVLIFEPKDPSFGTAFYACPDPECNFRLTVGARVRKEPCPECTYPVVERRRRPTPEEQRMGLPGKPFWSCVRYPDCKYAQDMAEFVD